MPSHARTSARLLALLATAALALTACSSGSNQGSNQGSSGSANASGVQLVNPGKLTQCSDIPYKPFEFSQDGKNVGFDIDMGNEIAKDLGVQLDVITTAFEAIQSGTALNTGQCDVAISGISITDARKTVMDFSNPYLDDNLGLMVTKSSGIKSIDDLKNKVVGVQDATTGKAYAESHGLNTRVFEDTGLVNNAISSGQVDAVINNISVDAEAVSGNNNLAVVQTYDTGEQLGMAVKKGNTAMLDAVNNTLKRIKGDGTYQHMLDTWIPGGK